MKRAFIGLMLIAGAAIAQGVGQIILLANGTATSVAVGWPGGQGVFSANGTVNGSTLTLQYLSNDGTTWIAATPTNTACTFTTLPNNCLFSMGPGQIRVAITGGPPSGVYAFVQRVGP